MRARLPANSRISLDTQKAIKEAVAEEAATAWLRTHFVSIALMAIALNETLHLGNARLQRVIQVYVTALEEFNADLLAADDAAIFRVLAATKSRGLDLTYILNGHIEIPKELLEAQND